MRPGEAGVAVPTRRALRARRRGLVLRRIRAVLAGGLVFGIGCAGTLASWNDAEFTAATFSAGRFDIVGSTTGAAGSFGQHAAAGSAAALSFSIVSPGSISAMAPGDTAYALYSVRTTALPADSAIPGAVNSVKGAVQLIADSGNSAAGTLGAYLTYRVRTIAGTSCTSTTFGSGTAIIPASGNTETDVPLSTSAAQTQALAAAGGNQVNYCFAITLPAGTPNAAQGATLTARWTFTATT